MRASRYITVAFKLETRKRERKREREREEKRTKKSLGGWREERQEGKRKRNKRWGMAGEK